MRRMFWTGTGYVLGLGSSVWVQRRVRRAVQRYTPEQVREQVRVKGRDLAERARQGVVDLRDAAVEGRQTMRAVEAELRSQYGGSDAVRPVAASGDDAGRHTAVARAVTSGSRTSGASRPRMH